MNRAPVARARARLAIASHRMLTPNGTRISVRRLPIVGGHRGRDLRADLELVGVIGLVAEQDAVDAGLLEDRQVAAEDLDEAARTGGGVVVRAAGQAREVEHRDDRLGRPEDPLECVHRSSSGWRRPAPARASVASSFGAGDDDLDAQRRPARPARPPAPPRSVTRVRIRAGVGTTALAAIADLRAVGDDDDPGRPLDRQPLDLRLGVVELGQAPPGAQPGGADDGQVEPEAGRGSPRRPVRRRSARRAGRPRRGRRPRSAASRAGWRSAARR